MARAPHTQDGKTEPASPAAVASEFPMTGTVAVFDPAMCRDPVCTKMLLVTLAEATPVHEVSRAGRMICGGLGSSRSGAW